MAVERFGVRFRTFGATEEGTRSGIVDLPDEASAGEPRTEAVGLGGRIKDVEPKRIVGEVEHRHRWRADKRTGGKTRAELILLGRLERRHGLAKLEGAAAVEMLVEGIALDNGATFDRLVGEGGLVDRGEEFEGATGFETGGVRAVAAFQIGDKSVELGPVSGADVGREALPSLKEGIVLRGGGQGDFPIVAGIAVEVVEFDGGFLVIEPDVGVLPGAQGAVDDGAEGAVGESHHGHGNVFDFDVTIEGARHRADLVPFAKEVEKVIHGVNAQSHGGAAEFSFPASTPRHGVVSCVTIPEGVAHPDERAPELTAGNEPFEVNMRRGKAHLEDATGVTSGAELGFADLVELGEGAAQGFLTEDPSAGFHGGDAHAGVTTGRRRNQHDIGTDDFEHFVKIGEGLRHVGAFAELFDQFLVKVDGGDQFDPTFGELDSSEVGVGDGAGADKYGAVDFTHEARRESRLGFFTKRKYGKACEILLGSGEKPGRDVSYNHATGDGGRIEENGTDEVFE